MDSIFHHSASEELQEKETKQIITKVRPQAQTVSFPKWTKQGIWDKRHTLYADNFRQK